MKKQVFFATFLVTLSLYLNLQTVDTRSQDRRIQPGLPLMGLSLVAKDTLRIKLKTKQTFEGYYQGYFSPDGAHLALLYRDHIDIVQIDTGDRLFRTELPKNQFLTVAFSPSGKTFASRSVRSDSGFENLILWDAMTGREIRTFVESPPGASGVDNLSFSGDGRLLASHAGGVARIWDVDSGRVIAEFSPPSDPPGLKPVASLLSPDGQWIVVDFRRFIPPTFYDVTKVWNLKTGQETELQTDVYRDWRFSSDSRVLMITATEDKGKITERSVAALWDVGTWIRKNVIEAPSGWQGAFTLAFSPNGEIIAIGGRKMFGLFSDGGELLTERAHPILEFDSPIYYDLTHLEFSPNGKQLLTAGNDSNVRLWKVKR